MRTSAGGPDASTLPASSSTWSALIASVSACVVTSTVCPAARSAATTSAISSLPGASNDVRGSSNSKRSPALLERLGDEDALPLPGRQLADVAVGDRHDLKTFHGLLHDAAVVDREAPEQAGGEPAERDHLSSSDGDASVDPGGLGT